MIRVCFFFLFAVLYSKDGIVLTIENHNYSMHDFFSRFPKQRWEHADSLQKEKMINGFIERELCVMDAKMRGFQNSPDVAVRAYNRSLQILVNESYEHFVARPLLPQSDLDLARKSAKKELFVNHILVGYSGSALSSPPNRTLDEALLLIQKIKDELDGGGGFSSLAEKYSDDPGVDRDFGAVGWVGWGATVPEFQRAVFSLERDVTSSPVLTSFGYHLILVSDSRPSEYQYMDSEEYENLIINITKNIIKDKLRPAAIEYDNKMIEEFGVVFNMDAINYLLDSYINYQNNLVVSSGNSSSSFLKTINSPLLLCVYNNAGYGPKWFGNRLDRMPSSRQPQIGSKDKMLSVFRTIILQDIAILRGIQGGVDSSFSYRWKCEDMVSGLLYDSYLKYLVNSVIKPDSLSIKEYYEINKNEKYIKEDERVVVHELRVSNKGLADSLFSLINSGADFLSLAKQYSIIVSKDRGLSRTVSKTQNNLFFDLLEGLDPGEISSVFLSSGADFSILQLVERLPLRFVDLNLVFSNIESFLIKERQDDSKKHGIEVLLEKYAIKRGSSLLY